MRVTLTETLALATYAGGQGHGSHFLLMRDHLHELKDQFRLAIDTVPGLVWSAQPCGEIDYLNARWLDYTGMTLAQARGWGWQQAIHPDDVLGLTTYWRAVLASGQPGEYEARLRRHDGVFRWFLFRGVPLYDDEATLIKWYGQTVDIDDRHQTEELLRNSEHMARAQLEALRQAMLALSSEPQPERFLGRVLHGILDQLEAHSVSVWETTASGQVAMVGTYQPGCLQLVERSEAPNQTRINTEHPVWTPFFSSGELCVFGRIQSEPPFSMVSLSLDGPWYDWRADMVTNPHSSPTVEKLVEMGIRVTLCVPLLMGGRVAGMLSIRLTRAPEFRPEELELARAMAHQAMLGIQLMHLSRHTREAAVMEERNRLARDIHDTLAQGFTGVIVQLEAVKGALASGALDDAAARVQRAGDLARLSLAEARRSVMALRPRGLQEGDLCLALEQALERITAGLSLRTEFVVQGPVRGLPAEQEENLLRIAQESLTNTIKHAEASRFGAVLSFEEDRTALSLRDDGTGFDPTAEHDGFGLLGMRERVARLGGDFQLRSSERGTEIDVTFPNRVHV